MYGRLTDVEVKSVRLDRDLRDPARLLNELADDGIDFEKFFEPANKPKPTLDAASKLESVAENESEHDIDEGDIDG